MDTVGFLLDAHSWPGCTPLAQACHAPSIGLKHSKALHGLLGMGSKTLHEVQDALRPMFVS